MRFGVHVGIGHGFRKTVEEALDAGCECIQIFAGNPRAFRITAYDAKPWSEFRDLRLEHGIAPTIIHTSYLINLATANAALHKKSAALVANDLAVAAMGGIEYVNTHLGSYGDQDRKRGFTRVCATIAKLIAQARPGPMLLLENSAGAGNLCGGRLDELGAILREVGSSRLGVCLDTAHAWASGYDLASKGGFESFLSEVKRHIGFERVRAFHLNDTEVELGAHRDLHWHVGKGRIGDSGFRRLLRVSGLAHVAGVCETPKTAELDKLNVANVKRLAGRRAGARGDASGGTAKRKMRSSAEHSKPRGGRMRA
jgi:deoxyribonuclease-4